MKTVVFRADGSERLGMGHVMRCLAFADHLQGIGFAPVFVTRMLESKSAAAARQNGVAVEEIPAGLSAQGDADCTIEIAGRLGARLVITDVCHRPAMANPGHLEMYHRRLARSRFTAALSAGYLVDLPCQMIVSPYVSSTSLEAPGDDERVFLLGPSFFIFRREFREAARMPRTIARRAGRVLITVGGSDELRFTVKIVRALLALARPELEARIVIGPGYADDLRRELEALTAPVSARFHILKGVSDLASHMLWADLAITGDGLTKYETAVTGTPSLMLSRPESEQDINRCFEDAGTTIHVGNGAGLDGSRLGSIISGVLDDVELRAAMSRRGRELLDGRGIERILERIPQEILR